MIIMIDNYDSFTYNLYQYIGTINPDIEVYRNDKITVDEVLKRSLTILYCHRGRDSRRMREYVLI